MWAIVQLDEVLLVEGVSALAVGIMCTVVHVIVGVVACWEPFSSPKGTASIGLFDLCTRGGLAASSITVTAILAESGYGVLSGLAAVFPAIFITTMVSLWLAQGHAVPIGAIGPMMLGSISVSIFALAAALQLYFHVSEMNSTIILSQEPLHLHTGFVARLLFLSYVAALVLGSLSASFVLHWMEKRHSVVLVSTVAGGHYSATESSYLLPSEASVS